MSIVAIFLLVLFGLLAFKKCITSQNISDLAELKNAYTKEVISGYVLLLLLVLPRAIIDLMTTASKESKRQFQQTAICPNCNNDTICGEISYT